MRAHKVLLSDLVNKTNSNTATSWLQAYEIGAYGFESEEPLVGGKPLA